MSLDFCLATPLTTPGPQSSQMQPAAFIIFILIFYSSIGIWCCWARFTANDVLLIIKLDSTLLGSDQGWAHWHLRLDLHLRQLDHVTSLPFGVKQLRLLPRRTSTSTSTTWTTKAAYDDKHSIFYTNTGSKASYNRFFQGRGVDEIYHSVTQTLPSLPLPLRATQFFATAFEPIDPSYLTIVGPRELEHHSDFLSIISCYRLLRALSYNTCLAYLVAAWIVEWKKENKKRAAKRERITKAYKQREFKKKILVQKKKILRKETLRLHT